jgi:retron-type reverse transcriptase
MPTSKLLPSTHNPITKLYLMLEIKNRLVKRYLDYVVDLKHPYVRIRWEHFHKSRLISQYLPVWPRVGLEANSYSPRSLADAKISKFC